MILPTETPESQPRIVPRELNFDFGQFFYPQEKRKICEIRYFSSEIKDEYGNKQVIKAVINPAGELGTLTTFDERVFYVLVEIWKEQGKPEIAYFSEREIARRLRLGWGQCVAKAINDSLNRLRIVGIIWKGSFYCRKQEKFIEIKNPFTILSYLCIVSTKDKNFRGQIAEFSFDKHTIENLNANYARPIRFDVILSFKSPLAQALYIHLDRKLYGTKKYNRATEALIVNDLALLAKSYQRKAIRIQEIRKLESEIKGKQTGYGEVIEKYEIDTNRKEDAILKVSRSGSAKIKGKKIEVPKGKHNNQSNSESEPKQIKDTPRQTPVEVLKALEYFQKVFWGNTEVNASPKVLSEATKIVKKHGLDKTKFLVDYAHKKARETNYKPATFNGISRYLAEALKEQERQKIIDRNNEEKLRKTHLENRKIDHVKQYEPAYLEYIEALIKALTYQYPQEIGEFMESEITKRQELEKAVENTSDKSKRKIAELKLRTFARTGQKALRFVTHFQRHPEIKIPDFWQWDREHNPNKFYDLPTQAKTRQTSPGDGEDCRGI